MKPKRFIELLYNYKKSYRFFGCRSSKNFIEYLRANDVIVGENVTFRNPRRTNIDLTRPWLISIGNNCGFNDYFAIMTHDFMTRVFRELYHDFVPSSGEVRIGNNCTFGRNVLLLKGAVIGDNCCIGAGSIVTKDVPPNSLAVGAPCRRICSIEEYYKKRKEECIEEAIKNGVAYYKRFGKLPSIEDFYEEWALFMDRQELENYPEMRKHVDFRLKEHFDIFFKNQKKAFDGFDDFLSKIENRIKNQEL